MLNAAIGQSVDNSIAMCMDVMCLCGLTVAGIASLRKDVKQLIGNYKSGTAQNLDYVTVLLDVLGLIPIGIVPTLVGLASLTIHLV